MAKIGIDIIENKRINLKNNFFQKVLHSDEIVLLNLITNEQSKVEFICGRWAAKEAIIKCYEKKISMSSINISYENNKPVILNENLKSIEISISHERNYSVAVAINL